MTEVVQTEWDRGHPRPHETVEKRRIKNLSHPTPISCSGMGDGFQHWNTLLQGCDSTSITGTVMIIFTEEGAHRFTMKIIVITVNKYLNR